MEWMDGPVWIVLVYDPSEPPEAEWKAVCISDNYTVAASSYKNASFPSKEGAALLIEGGIVRSRGGYKEALEGMVELTDA